MTLNITLPQLNSNTKSTKDKIISVLSNKWPLSAKELYNILQREHGAEVSYQAVHKILNELQEEKILEKNGKSYQISKEWIQQVKRFGSELEENYTNGKKIDFEHFESMHLVFDSFMELARFIINDYFQKFPTPTGKESVCYWRHAFGIIGMSETEYNNLKKMFSETTHYGICRSDSFIDKWFSEYYKKINKRCVTGIDYPFHDETYVFGDFICFAFFPKEFTKKIDKFYATMKEANSETLQKYSEILLNEKVKIDVLITKNPTLANFMREYAVKAYEGR